MTGPRYPGQRPPRLGAYALRGRLIPGIRRAFFMPKTLDHYLSERRIVRLLSRKRVKAARITRRERFFQGASENPHSPREKPPYIYQLMPPRRHWPRSEKEARLTKSSDAASAQAFALSQYVLAMLAKPGATYDWLKELRKFIAEVQQRGRNWQDGDACAPVRVVVCPKKGRNFRDKCRTLTIYKLQDNVLASCFAAYLRDQIDAHLHDHALAFRSAKEGAVATHHDAIPLIQSYRGSFRHNQKLWVAECDIEGFFDAVAHQTVIDELSRFAENNAIVFDARFWAFLRSFLACYSYTNYTEPRARNYLASLGVLEPKIPDPRGSLAKRGIVSAGNHGIPQGSAMSCILANIVLASADVVVESALTPQNSKAAGGLYLRFCDDIVIVHTSKDACGKALAAYTECLDQLKLPYYKPVPTGLYGKAFWSSKSKSPYLWGGDGDCSSPWLAFVGYQIRRDGRIRVRRDSIAKEVKKQRKALSQVFKHLYRKMQDRPITGVPKGITFRTLMHLISFSVGNPTSKHRNSEGAGISWVRGFRELKGKTDLAAIRRLDQARTSTVKRQKRHLRYLENEEKIFFYSRNSKQKTKGLYPGRAYSYYAHFQTDRTRPLWGRMLSMLRSQRDKGMNFLAKLRLGGDALLRR